SQPASWTPTPSEFQAAAQKTAAALDEIEKWLKHARKAATSGGVANNGPKLSGRQSQILKVMLTARATDGDSRITTAEIAQKVDPASSAASFKTPMAGLKLLDYVQSAGRGRGSGFWLTRSGKERARAMKWKKVAKK